MSFRGDGTSLECDGCHRDITTLDYRAMHLPNLTVEHYHEACWQTGWYTGIPPKGEFPEPEASDPVNHPDHYTWLPKGIEVIDITETLDFCLGNVVKYVLRADHKGNPLEDLRKARWYVERAIVMREREIANREAAE